jgi:hypothetical protein
MFKITLPRVSAKKTQPIHKEIEKNDQSFPNHRNTRGGNKSPRFPRHKPFPRLRSRNPAVINLNRPFPSSARCSTEELAPWQNPKKAMSRPSADQLGIFILGWPPPADLSSFKPSPASFASPSYGFVRTSTFRGYCELASWHSCHRPNAALKGKTVQQRALAAPAVAAPKPDTKCNFSSYADPGKCDD